MRELFLWNANDDVSHTTSVKDSISRRADRPPPVLRQHLFEVVLRVAVCAGAARTRLAAAVRELHIPEQLHDAVVGAGLPRQPLDLRVHDSPPPGTICSGGASAFSRRGSRPICAARTRARTPGRS